MSWFSKKLKKVTKVLDPVGAKLRKSTGGSYGDPMNWYQSKPNQTIPYQQRTSPGLTAQPSGPAPPGMSFGQNTGGYNYLPNRFAGGNMAPPMAGGMSFGGPRDAMAQTMPQQPQPTMNPQMQNQMARIGAIRGSTV